jgi:nucleoside-diphosphate-sugar epimerase
VAVGPLAPTRDFVDVRDVAAALRLAADRAAPGSILNVASGVETSVGEVLSALVRAANVEIAIVERGGVAAGVDRNVADISRLRQLGFQPAHRVEQSLGDLLDWYRRADAPRPGAQRGV